MQEKRASGTRQRSILRIPDEEQAMEPGGLHSRDHLNETTSPGGYSVRSAHGLMMAGKTGLDRFMTRFLRKGKPKVGFLDSLKAILFSSWVNVFLLVLPVAWGAHFSNISDGQKIFSFPVTFTLCLLAIIPLEKLFDFGGEQMAFYLGKDIGDLVVVTLNNAVEATLAIILLKRCELRLLQSTIIGVVILHLLLIPGTAFVVGGARVMHQDLHPHLTELNHSLLVMGVLSLLLPAAFFAAIDRGTQALSDNPSYIVNDIYRHKFVTLSRGLALILLVIYVASRIYLHDPPGPNDTLAEHPDAPMALLDEEEYLMHGNPEVSQWVCLGMLAITIGLMAATAEFLVDSIEFVRDAGGIQEEWFGLILLPIISFAADGFVAIGFFLRYVVEHLLGRKTPPATLAKARAIDLSIQFILFWMPFIVLLGWWTGKPITLLFDIFEVAVLIGAMFLVNYVTADSKTNWLEGWAMVSFYLMIALTTWFYDGQTEIGEMLNFGGCFSSAEPSSG
ncbi:hypothetical protein BDP27DRAFT_801689 [Rhodocollybia butyracea]|uniref:Sodium/calcium exchanger membrane region domain-containing protein n=1 Tax=Rhodocollybia butyracea TaxID=206335 RepID=A0A9P5Q1R8_9AGAR|nr:hypothetical protein BDP27DRAFT_801689 [Rhodocollybia butyracea]